MAHNLNIENGQASFASVGKAWHGLGVQLKEKMNAEEALKLAKLDYEVHKLPTQTQPFIGEDGSLVQPIPTGHHATVRMDTMQPLGNVGERYQVLQNRDAFSFFDPIIDRDEAIYESAGALGLGETIFLTAKMPEYITLSNGDEIENYVVFTNSHDGSSAMRAMITPVRVVCQNTLAASVRRKVGSVTIRHTSNMAGRMAEASKVLGLTSKLSEEIEEVSNALIKKRVSDKRAKKVIINFACTPQEIKALTAGEAYEEVISAKKQNMIGRIEEFYFAGVGQENVVGNAFGLYNGLTGWLQHARKSRDESSRLQNILFSGTREKALSLVTSLK